MPLTLIQQLSNIRSRMQNFRIHSQAPLHLRRQPRDVALSVDDRDELELFFETVLQIVRHGG